MQPKISLTKKRILLTGGAGYIGSAVLPKLLACGYDVRLLDLFLFGHEPIATVADHPNLEIVYGDFRDVGTVVSAMQGVDTVIHLGAIVGDPACALDEKMTIEINLMATRMIANIAKSCGVSRFIFASTCSVYGAGDTFLTEESQLNPISLYARSKIASEKVLLDLADEFFHPVLLRFGTIYGLSGRTRFDLVVNLLTAKAQLEHKITVFGGDQWRPFVHVDDAALSVAMVTDAPLHTVSGQIFNVGSNEQNHQIWEIGEMIHEIIPSAQLIDNGNDIDLRNYRVNFAKINHALGFRAQWNVEQGIYQVLEAIQSGRVCDYQHEHYSNVKQFRKNSLPSLDHHYDSGWAYQLVGMFEPAMPMPVAG